MKQSFEHIMEEYGQLLWRVAATYEARESLKQELFQEICVAIWQALARFKGDSSLKTYLLRVAHNRGVSHVSKEVKSLKAEDEHDTIDQALDMSTVENSHEKRISQSRQLRVLLAAIRQLKLSHRQVITLAMEGLSYQEIADITGLSMSAVGVTITRLKQQLKEQLDHDE